MSLRTQERFIKKIILALILLATNIFSSAFAKSVIEKETCLNLVSAVSDIAYSKNGNRWVTEKFGLNSIKVEKYFADTRTAIKNKMESFCKSSNNSGYAEDFLDLFVLM